MYQLWSIRKSQASNLVKFRRRLVKAFTGCVNLIIHGRISGKDVHCKYPIYGKKSIRKRVRPLITIIWANL